MSKFCYTKQLNIAKTKVGASSAVAFRNKYWPKYQEFKIYFIDAPESQKTESQLIIIATELGLKAKVEDLKKDTVDLE